MQTKQKPFVFAKGRMQAASFIMAADSYKTGHFEVMPDGTDGMSSYIEPRISGKIVVPFGIQMWVMKNLTIKITQADIDEAEEFFKLRDEPFAKSDWEYLVEKYDGVIPIKVRAIKEGTPIPSRNAIVTVECTDPRLFWLAAYVETSLQRAVWYPSTIASRDREVMQMLDQIYTDFGGDKSLLPFVLHDFGARGVTCSEQAEIGGAAHLVMFMGSDTVEGVRAANWYYRATMAGYSVRATEHTVQCAYGRDGQGEYLRKVLTTWAKPGRVVSVVLDGFDLERETRALCTEFKDLIIASGAKIVARPDSGDMMQTVPMVIRMLDEAFGHTINSKGLKKLNYVGVIQGDGVDPLAMRSLLTLLISMGYAPDNVVFGSGGALLQKLDRDTFKWAQKTSAVRINGVWVPTPKDPITDPGKKSKEGRLSVYLLDGEYVTYDMLTTKLPEGANDAMYDIYDCGVFGDFQTLDEIKSRAAV